MDKLDVEVLESWVETMVEVAHKQVIDSLPELFKDDLTNVNLIWEIIQRYQEIDEEVAKRKAFAKNLKLNGID